MRLRRFTLMGTPDIIRAVNERKYDCCVVRRKARRGGILLWYVQLYHNDTFTKYEVLGSQERLHTLTTGLVAIDISS